MKIGLVGGLDRNAGAYEQLASRAGYGFEQHNGHLSGRGAAVLEAMIDRCDVLVVVTDVNSHGAVWRARKLARLRGRQCLLMSRCGPSKFSELLRELSPQQAPRLASASL